MQSVVLQLENCRDVDPQNIDSYNDAVFLYLYDNSRLQENIDNLLYTEMNRAHRSTHLIDSKRDQISQTIDNEMVHEISANREGWLALCRGLPENVKNQRGEFQLLDDLYPHETHLINHWH
jgi:hypothetical protein